MNEIIKRVADAIQLAEVGYHLRLTSLVDGVSTYTLSYDDDASDLTFECIDDAYAHIANKKREAAARLAIAAMREPTAEMRVADAVKEWPDDAAACWRAMIDAALAPTLTPDQRQGEAS